MEFQITKVEFDFINKNEFEKGSKYEIIYDNTCFTRNASALLDTGSPINSIKADFIPQEAIQNVSGPYQFIGLNKSKMIVLATISAQVT